LPELRKKKEETLSVYNKLKNSSEEESKREIERNIAEKKRKIDSENKAIKEANRVLNEKKLQIQERLNTVAIKAKTLQDLEKKKTEVEAINNQQIDVLDQIQQLKQKLSILNQFDKEQVELIENPINKHFSFVKFSLFKYQKNGELKPSCNILSKANDTPIEAMSAAERIIATIDLNKGFQAMEGIELPLIVDDADLITMDLDKHIGNRKSFQLYAKKGDFNLSCTED